MLRTRWMSVVVGMFTLALVLAACGGDDEGGGATGTTGATTGATGDGGGGATLTIEGFAFDPSTLQVGTGNVTITITNNDSATHSFTTDDDSVDETIPAGETVEVALTTAGVDTLGFHCRFHSSMTGTLEFS